MLHLHHEDRPDDQLGPRGPSHHFWWFRRIHSHLDRLSRHLRGLDDAPRALEGIARRGHLWQLRPDGPFVALWLYPDLAARRAHRACIDDRPYAGRELRYTHAALTPQRPCGKSPGYAPTTALRLRRCTHHALPAPLRIADLVDAMELLTMLHDTLEVPPCP